MKVLESSLRARWIWLPSSRGGQRIKQIVEGCIRFELNLTEYLYPRLELYRDALQYAGVIASSISHDGPEPGWHIDDCEHELIVTPVNL